MKTPLTTIQNTPFCRFNSSSRLSEVASDKSATTLLMLLKLGPNAMYYNISIIMVTNTIISEM